MRGKDFERERLISKQRMPYERVFPTAIRPMIHETCLRYRILTIRGLSPEFHTN